jgi:hypothetical protein
MLGLMNARRIQKDNLGVRLREYAQNTIARRLGLITHNGDFLPDKGIY